MAFPVVASLTATVFTSTATAHLVNMPATVNSGDLLITKFVNQVDAVTTPSGWTQLHSTANTVRLGTYYRIADGTEGGIQVNFVTSSPRRAAAHVYRITSWHGTTPPEVGTAATGNSTLPDPPTLSPSWGAEDTLWLAGTGAGAIVTVSVYPTSYTDGADDDATTTAPTVASARRELNATSDDPGTFTISGSTTWVAQTLAIRPAAAAAGADPYPYVGGGYYPTEG